MVNQSVIPSNISEKLKLLNFAPSSLKPSFLRTHPIAQAGNSIIQPNMLSITPNNPCLSPSRNPPSSNPLMNPLTPAIIDVIIINGLRSRLNMNLNPFRKPWSGPFFIKNFLTVSSGPLIFLRLPNAFFKGSRTHLPKKPNTLPTILNNPFSILEFLILLKKLIIRSNALENVGNIFRIPPTSLENTFCIFTTNSLFTIFVRPLPRRPGSATRPAMVNMSSLSSILFKKFETPLPPPPTLKLIPSMDLRSRSKIPACSFFSSFFLRSFPVNTPIRLVI